jgi:dipeptidyl aminopeptidase/acylaminoacyl peptidase
MKKLYLFTKPLLISFILSACSNSSSVAPKDTSRIVEGVDFDLLFAKPSEAEINAVLSEWSTREVSAQSYSEVSVSSLQMGNSPGKLRLVSHTVGGVKHYGAIAVPDGKAARSLPVLIYTHGGDDGFSTDEIQLILFVNAADADKFILIAPSYRSEPLRAQNDTLVSAGEPSPWDRDVDDALALLNVTLQTTPEADPERIGILGFSRGACVGMLMAIRDPRIDLVIEFFGPTDFLNTFVQTVAEEALRGHPRDLPGLDVLNAKLLQPLKNGKLTINEVRPELVRRSPVYFAAKLPQLQVHHGTADDVVPVAEAERLIEVMRGLGRIAPNFESYLYPGGGHNPLTLTDSIERTFTFLRRLLPGALYSLL